MTKPATRPATPRRNVWWRVGVLVVGTCLCYLPAMRAGFIWDDDSMLTANPFVKLPLGLYYIWGSTALPDYWPLTYSSFWLEWRVWGMNPSGYHVTNILLHAGSAVLLWRVLARLQVPGAWLAAMVFAVHPVNVESVAWITERKNTLSLFFCLLAVLWYLRFDAESRITNHESCSRKWYWLALLAFVLSLLAKTAPVMLPVVLLLYHWWRGHSPLNPNRVLNLNPTPADEIENKIRVKNLTLRLAPFFLVSLAMGLATLWFQTHRAIGDDVIRTEGFLSRLAGAGRAVWFYLYKAFVPVDLSFVYPRWEINPDSFFSWLPLAALVALLIGLMMQRRIWSRAALFGLGSFLLLLLPVLGFFNVYYQRYSLVADHWQYFALPAVIALVVGGVSMFGGDLWAWSRRIAGAAIVIVLAALAWKQTQIYADSGTLWRDTLKKNPASWLALNNLGNLLMAQGDSAGAKDLHLRSLELNPNQIEAHNNIGEILLLEGRVAEAKEHYQHALKINPRVAMTLYNLANVLDREGKTDEAMATYRRALEIDPLHAEAHNNLGCILYAAGKTSEAIEEFVRASTLRPDYADALNNLGAVFQDRGEFAEAESQFREAVRIDPFHADAHSNLGNALLSQGRTTEAGPVFLRVLELDPNNALAHCRLGSVLWQLGRTEPAVAEITAALKLQPTLAEAHHQLGLMLTAKRDFAGAIDSLRRANNLRTNWPEALASLGFTLASAPTAQDRNGAEALRLSTRAVALTYETNAVALDALAAASAEVGKFEEAVQIAAQAVKLESAAGRTNRAAKILARQRFYESKQPYHE